MVSRLLGLVSILGFLSACSAAKFTSKSDVLSKSSVFGQESDGTGTIRQPAGDEGRSLMDEIARELRQGPADEATVTLMCSDRRSQDAPNLKRAIANNLPVQLSVGEKSCTTNPQTILKLVSLPKITRDDLSAICAASLPAAGTPLALTVIIDGSANTSTMGRLTVLYARNQDTTVPAEAADAKCDKNSSPLVIHVASDVNDPKPIALSSQEDGVDFDLLGETTSHDKVRISWFTNQDYRLLALPNERGQVRGINELFGDNTAGPDGEFSANGYAALAKFDGTSVDGMLQLSKPDGRIDNRDPIFRKLRLWLDKNRDGIGQADELVSLSRAGITYIDLDFSSDFAETDQYGNETKMKSVVGLRDGSLDLIFDLWFSYNLGGLNE